MAVAELILWTYLDSLSATSPTLYRRSRGCTKFQQKTFQLKPKQKKNEFDKNGRMKPMLKFDFIALKHTVKLSQMKTELFQPFDFFFLMKMHPALSLTRAATYWLSEPN